MPTPARICDRRREYQEALQAAKQINMPEFHWALFAIAAVCGQLDRQQEARTAMEALRRISPAFLELAVARED